MLVTSDFVLLHVRKTGGVFLNELCREHLAVAHEQEHGRWTQIPSQFEHLPAFAVVRNPWDWYVSWYVFSKAVAGPDHRLLGRDGFAETLEAACHSRPRLRHGSDLYSFWFWRIAGDGFRAGRVEIGRFESMRTDFLQFLDSRNSVISGEFRRAVLESEPVNRSPRGAYRDYYDDSTRELITDRCEPIIREFGYMF